MNAQIFKTGELVSIKTLCERGDIPKALRTVRELCRKGKFPAVKDGREWKTTEAAVRGHFYKKGNATFRKVAV